MPDLLELEEFQGLVKNLECMDCKPISNLTESVKTELNGLFPSLKCLQEGAASPIGPGLPHLHVGDRTHITVQTEVLRQHLCVMHQCGGAGTLGSRLSVSTHAMGQLVRLRIEKQRKWHCYTGGKTFAMKNPYRYLRFTNSRCHTVAHLVLGLSTGQDKHGPCGNTLWST